MRHLVLLGDSILDNGSYTAGGPAVIAHLRARVPADWQVTLLAVDGSLTSDVPEQIARLPADATHLVLSAGGNNALLQSGFVSEPAQSVADVLQRMAAIAQRFEEEYQATLSAMLACGLPTIVCTVYYPNFPDPLVQQLMTMGLLLFNDRILASAIEVGIPVIDLRRVCTTPADYANEIEPSVQGGANIAAAIMRVVTLHDFTKQRTTVYV
ncbi:MAG: SGNH/GDSL hydrolase family protein [Chloroflexaceae bacterium]|nr:SGNH/GDSL hydrolase family protein [Chloroflexaceae bacterium]